VDLGIRDRVAVVAASSKGLGREAARSLAEEGVKVVLCARGEDELKKTAEAIGRDTGTEILDVAADLTREADVRRLVERTVERFGTVHILVNNCGGPPAGTFLDHDLDRWRRAVETNLMSAVMLTREVVPFMIKNGWGRIVNITSISVKQPLPNLILSNSIRAAVIGWAKTLASELGKYDILVNNLCQGYFLTDRLYSLAEGKANEEGRTVEDVLGAWSETVPVGRVGRPEEFGPLVAFLASERASYITGDSIAIDGGFCQSLL